MHSGPVVRRVCPLRSRRVVQSFVPAGRAPYAVGSDPEAARLAGIRPRRVVFVVYVLAGAVEQPQQGFMRSSGFHLELGVHVMRKRQLGIDRQRGLRGRFGLGPLGVAQVEAGHLRLDLR